MEKLNNPKRRTEYLSIYLLRFLLALLVVVVHFWQKTGNSLGGFFGLENIYYVSLGGVAVSLFLVISGVFTAKIHQKLLQFWKKRFTKLFSVYWASIIVNFLLFLFFYYLLRYKNFAFEQITSIYNILVYLFGLIGFNGEWDHAINTPVWFIGLLAFLYLINPLLVPIIKKKPVTVLLYLFIISISSRYIFSKYPLLPPRAMDWFPLSRVFEYGLGIYLSTFLPLLSGSKVEKILSFFPTSFFLFFSDIAFPLFLVHYPLLRIIDHFPQNQTLAFLSFLFISLISAVLTLLLTKIHIVFLLISALIILSGSLFQYQNQLSPLICKLTSDGVWTWISDPRAIYVSQTNQIFTGWVTKDGSIVISRIVPNSNFNCNNSQVQRKIIYPFFEINDHVNPALLFSRNTLKVFFSSHANAEGIHSFELDPTKLVILNSQILSPDNNPVGTQYTYVSPVAVGSNTFLFYRGERRKPFMLVLDDKDEIIRNTLLIDTYEEDTYQRPYVKYSGNDGVIHLAYTKGHPREIIHNSIYYKAMRSNQFDNTSTLIDMHKFLVTDGQLVFDADARQQNAMIWDIKVNSDKVAIAYAIFPSPTEHQYFIAIKEYSDWVHYYVGSGGPAIPQTPPDQVEPEPYFSSGITIDPENLNRVYYSKRVICEDNLMSWDIVAKNIKTNDELNITNCSTLNNVRPYSVSTKKGSAILWLSLQKYVGYTNYDSSIYYTFLSDSSL